MADASDFKDLKLSSPAPNSEDVKPKLPGVGDKASASEDTVDDKTTVFKDLKLKLSVDVKIFDSKDVKPKLSPVADEAFDSKDAKPKLSPVEDETSDSKDVKPKLSTVVENTSDSKDAKSKMSSVDDKPLDSKDVKLKQADVDIKLKDQAIPVVDEKEKGKEKAKQVLDDDDLGLSLNKLNLGPKKKLLLLNFGGLLVDRVHLKEKHKVRGLRPDHTYGNFLVFKRPFCTDFLRFCFERFDVALWSSAMERNIAGVLSSITGGQENKFIFVWSQSECTDSGHHCLVKKQKSLFVKNLKRIWEHADYKGKYSALNTLLIDDEPHSSLLSPPNTAIFPHPYKKHDPLDTLLAPNGSLRKFLNGLVDAVDVPTYVEEHSIGQPAINERHPNWSFYKNVVDNFGKTYDYSSDDWYYSSDD